MVPAAMKPFTYTANPARIVFGAGTLNLFYVLRANIELIGRHGWMAVMDGGAQQLLELLVTGYLSLAAYVVFKVCEHRLVADIDREP